MKTYFIYNGKDQLGPFTINEIKNQKLGKNTLIWCEGLADWTNIENFPELNGLINTPPPVQSNIPPPINNYESYVPQQVVQSATWKPYLYTGLTLAVLIVSYLIYSNSIQASELKSLKIEQKKIDIALQTKESIEFKKEQEQKRTIAEKERKAKEFRKNWYEYIQVSNNNYRYSWLGGIYDLVITVTNNSDYSLEDVTASVIYVKSNGDVWKTIEVPVYNIAPHTEKSVNVADVERGTSVQLQISSVASKEANLCFSPGNWANNMDDAYFCK